MTSFSRRSHSLSRFCRSYSSSKSPSAPLTVLHKTRQLLQRTHSFRDPQNFGWEQVLESAYYKLNAKDNDSLNVVVLSLDDPLSARDLLTSLLQEAFPSHPAINEAITTRNDGPLAGEKILTIQYGTQPKLESRTLSVPSAFFTQFPAPLRIKEFVTAPDRALALPEVLSSDIPIFLFDPFNTPLRDAIHAYGPSHPNGILAATVVPSSSQQASIRAQSGLDDRLLFLEPARSISALQSLHSEHPPPSAIDKYQKEFFESNLHTLTEALKKITSEPTTFRKKAAFFQISQTLSAIGSSIDAANQKVQSLLSSVSRIESEMEVARAIGLRMLNSHEEKDRFGVTAVLNQAEKDIRPVVNALSWWTVLWRADEVASIISAAVQEKWCKDLEDSVIFTSGEWSSLQTHLTSLAIELVQSPTIIQSPVLVNELLQIKSSPSYALHPHSLTSNITKRRTQLLRYPTGKLHLAGQRAALGMMGSSAATTLFCWSTWVGWPDALNLAWISGETMMGIGILLSLGAFRLNVAHWEKSKRQWWKDYHRLGEGLQRDIEGTANAVMIDQVTAVARQASVGLSQLATQRQETISSALDELRSVQEEVLSLQRGGEA